MVMFQSLQSIKNELYLVLMEEGGSYVSVNVFEWYDRDIHTLKITKYYDVEINLFDESGKRIDNWVTDIMDKKLDAVRRSKLVYKSVNRWFSKREQVLMFQVKLYKERSEAENYESILTSKICERIF